MCYSIKTMHFLGVTCTAHFHYMLFLLSSPLQHKSLIKLSRKKRLTDNVLQPLEMLMPDWFALFLPGVCGIFVRSSADQKKILLFLGCNAKHTFVCTPALMHISTVQCLPLPFFHLRNRGLTSPPKVLTLKSIPRGDVRRLFSLFPCSEAE